VELGVLKVLGGGDVSVYNVGAGEIYRFRSIAPSPPSALLASEYFTFFLRLMLKISARVLRACLVYEARGSAG
jgi:hypothetical protein